MLVRLRVAQHAVLQTRHRVEQRQRRQLAAGQHEVAQAQFEIHVPIQKTLVDALVAAAQQHRTRARGEFTHQLLVDAPARRREVDHLHLAASRLHRQQRTLQRLNQHDHAGAAAIRPVVDAAVGAVGKVTQLPQLDLDLARLERAPRDAVRQVRSEQLGEQGDHVEAHACTEIQ